VPRCASSKRPTRWAIAPVNAPRSCPNSSLSSNPVGIAARLFLQTNPDAVTLEFARARIQLEMSEAVAAWQRLIHSSNRPPPWSIAAQDVTTADVPSTERPTRLNDA